ncbi:MAG: NAD-dependent protein deacylase, partial [Lachnospiraceae bacterium]|nr:NAD-dependent protein deacylase [Lachnospiraceae bacterium]
YHAQQVYGKQPEYLLSYPAFKNEPALFFRYYKENLISLDAKPNPAHIALAKWEQAGKLQAVITQNIDGLHQAAGSQNVFELHGSNWRQYCVDCGKRFDLAYIAASEGIPKCDRCGGTVRPDVVLYNETLNNAVVQGATEAIANAEVLLVGGTSLAVYPAAGLLHYFRGSHLVLINKSVTARDRDAQLVIHDAIGKVLSAVNL